MSKRGESAAMKGLAQAQRKVLEEMKAYLEDKVEGIKQRVAERQDEVVGLYRYIVAAEERGCFGGPVSESHHLYLGVINGEMKDRKGEGSVLRGVEELVTMLHIESHCYDYYHGADLAVPAKRIISGSSSFICPGFDIRSFANAKDGEIVFGRDEVAFAEKIDTNVENFMAPHYSPYLSKFRFAVGDEEVRKLLKETRSEGLGNGNLDIFGLLKDDDLYEKKVGNYIEGERQEFSRKLVKLVGDVALCNARIEDMEGTLMKKKFDEYDFSATSFTGECVREYHGLRRKVADGLNKINKSLSEGDIVGLREMKTDIDGSTVGFPSTVSVSAYLEYVTGLSEEVSGRVTKIDRNLKKGYQR